MIKGKHWSIKTQSNVSIPESGELKYRMTYDSKYSYELIANSYFNALQKCKIYLQEKYGIIDAEFSKLVIVRAKNVH
jgi:hypothetical protein